MNPKYPVYIVSKGRWESRLTARSLEKMHVPYWIVVEKQEYDQYCSVIDKKQVLILPQKYLDEYDVFDNLGDTKSKGPGAARNFAWQHSIDNGFDWHWVMDDNLDGFYRLNHNLRIRVESGTILCCAEDWCDRYENIAQAGLNYRFFASSNSYYPPYCLNTRIYSCLLIRNDIPFRWRGRYNEDTDLSLRILKAGWCTVQFYAFLCGKLATQVLKGGNTQEFYSHEGTSPKSKMLEDMHPDVARTMWRFNRDHHYVDYTPFKKNVLIKKKGIIIPKGINNYGMILNTK